MRRKPLLAALLATGLSVGLASAAPAPASAASTVTNPGFESGVGQSPSGWSERAAQTSASYSEAGGRSGGYRLITPPLAVDHPAPRR